MEEIERFPETPRDSKIYEVIFKKLNLLKNAFF